MPHASKKTPVATDRDALEFCGIGELTPPQAEMICHWTLSDDEKKTEHGKQFLAQQMLLADKLSGLFLRGGKHVSPDLRKAKEFGTIARNNNGEINPGNPYLCPQTGYTLFVTFTGIRLAGLRLDRITRMYLKKSYLPRFWTLASLSYIGELIFDMGVILYTLLRPERPDSAYKQLPLWDRFINVLTQDATPTRMFNAGLWTLVNSAFWWASKPLNTLLNLIGFGTDILVDSYKLWVEFKKCKGLRDAFKGGHDALKNKQNEVNAQKGLNKCDELNTQEMLIKLVLLKIGHSRNAVFKDKIDGVIVSACIFIGMVPVLYCASSPLLLFLGSLLAFGAGSVWAGFGRRFVGWMKKWSANLQKILFPEPSAKFSHHLTSDAIMLTKLPNTAPVARTHASTHNGAHARQIRRSTLSTFSTHTVMPIKQHGSHDDLAMLVPSSKKLDLF